MADNPNPDENVSTYQRTVVLIDWWLIKCPEEFEGKRFGVAGTQISETRARRGFTSSPIIKAYDVFTLEASDGVCIILRGFLNKERLLQSGFLPQISREFIFGFPPCWESKCNLCFVGGAPFVSPINKASRAILSPCNNNNNAKWNLEDSPSSVVERRGGKSTVVEKKKTEEETNDKDGRVGGSTTTPRDDNKPSRKKSLRLQSKSVEVISNVKIKTSSDGLSMVAKSGGVVAKDELINKEVISPADNVVDKVTCMRATEESQGKSELETTKACPHSMFEDLEKSGNKPGKKAASEKSGRILRSDGNAVEHSGTKVKRKLDVVTEVQKNPTTNDVVGHGSKKITRKSANKESLTSSEERKGKLKVTKTSLSDSRSKLGKNGKAKKSEQISAEPVTHSRSKVKDNLSSVGKTIRKIDFDEEVTPEKKQKTNNAVVSPDSLGQKRSRSGRLLVSPLEFWRNQVPVYDLDRNLIQVNEGNQTNSTPPSKGKGSVSRKPRR